MITREALHDLRAKYEEMLRLRIAHASPDEPDPRRDMAALAARFPGALREIDELTLAEICARLDAVTRAEPDSAEAWMHAHAVFHALMRGALFAKRWLAGRKRVDAATREAFARDAIDDARAWIEDLDRIASPPRGRVTEIVIERVARTLDLAPRDARALVFGPPRRPR